jgi:hypothetical protein
MAVRMGLSGRPAGSADVLKVRVAPGTGVPVSFLWRGAWHRVLSVEDVAAVGVERRCRVQTRAGAFELALDAMSGRWQMRRSPNWLERVWARWLNAPRYPLPAWRLRTGRRAAGLAAMRRRAAVPVAGPGSRSAKDAEDWAVVPC